MRGDRSMGASPLARVHPLLCVRRVCHALDNPLSNLRSARSRARIIRSANHHRTGDIGGNDFRHDSRAVVDSPRRSRRPHILRAARTRGCGSTCFAANPRGGARFQLDNASGTRARVAPQGSRHRSPALGLGDRRSDVASAPVRRARSAPKPGNREDRSRYLVDDNQPGTFRRRRSSRRSRSSSKSSATEVT